MGATIAGAECYNSDGAGRGVKNNGVYTPANEYQQAGIHADVKNHIVMSQSVIVKVLNYLKNYFSLSDYVERQSDIEAVIRSGVSFRGTNIFILIMAIRGVAGSEHQFDGGDYWCDAYIAADGADHRDGPGDRHT